jgi:hypothetical protein
MMMRIEISPSNYMTNNRPSQLSVDNIRREMPYFSRINLSTMKAKQMEKVSGIPHQKHPLEYKLRTLKFANRQKERIISLIVRRLVKSCSNQSISFSSTRTTQRRICLTRTN